MTVLNEAIAKFQPAWVFALVSGGHDSAAMLHLVKDRINAAVHIDTGTGIPQTRDYVEKLCRLMGIELKIYEAAKNTNKEGAADPQIYADIVRKFGFPGPAMHRFMYSRLKERPLRMLLRQHPGVKLLLTGVRSSESSRRMGYVEPVRIETRNKIWIAPCHAWDVTYQNAYMIANKIPRNAVKDCLGMSGECLCGAFAKPGELDRLREMYPATAARIDALEHELIVETRTFSWGWGERPPRIRSVPVDDLQREIEDDAYVDDLIAPLCIGCESNL